MSSEVKMALGDLPICVDTVIAGLGGRPILKASLVNMVKQACDEGLEEPHFLDLNWTAINNEFVRQQQTRRSGPIPENVLRDISALGAKN